MNLVVMVMEVEMGYGVIHKLNPMLEENSCCILYFAVVLYCECVFVLLCFALLLFLFLFLFLFFVFSN